MRSSREAVVEKSPWTGLVVIALAGSLLGVSYNWFGLNSGAAWGLPWIAEDRVALLEGEQLVSGTSDGDPYATTQVDPLAIVGAGLPEIRSHGRPLPIDLQAVEQYVAADAALVIDARDRFEYDEGHIPGAISLPADEAVTDPARLQALDTGGRPLIVYCGGGTCETSLDVAYELIAVGHERVAVYMGGFPEWLDAGNDVAVDAAGGGR